jgi:hypothetical protein
MYYLWELVGVGGWYHYGTEWADTDPEPMFDSYI